MGFFFAAAPTVAASVPEGDMVGVLLSGKAAPAVLDATPAKRILSVAFAGFGFTPSTIEP